MTSGYEIEPANGQGPIWMVNHSEVQAWLKPRPRLLPRVQRHPSRINRAPLSKSSGYSLDDSDVIFIALRTPLDPVPIPVTEPERPTLHPSVMLNKGQHANPYGEPRTFNN